MTCIKPEEPRRSKLHDVETLSAKDLVALLNWELSAYEECDGCRFTSVGPMRERDSAGANWLDARVQSDQRLGLDQQFIVQHVVEETRRSFELAPG